MRLKARLLPRHRPAPIPDYITTLALEPTTISERPHFARTSRLGHRIELNPSLVGILSTLIPTLTKVITEHDPTPFNAALNLELPPSVLPAVSAHLAHLDESIPEHKWAPHFRIHDLQRAYGIAPMGRGAAACS